MRKQARLTIDAIQRHIHRNYKRWFHTYSNIEGVEVALKQTKEKTLKNYSVAFHVSKKTSRARKKFPPFLTITLSRNKKIKVPTDVIETGRLSLEGIKVGDSIQNEHSQSIGTISFYLDGAQGMYVCSNMHILAPNLLARGQIYYDVRKGDPPQGIFFFDNNISSTAQLTSGRYNNVDIAFARVDNPIIPQIVERDIKSVGPITGFFSLTSFNLHTVSLSFFGRTSGLRPCSIHSVGVVKGTDFQNVYMTNLLKLELCTERGDSGSPVFDERERMVGIIIGRDTTNSYALHIYDVLNYFQQLQL